MKILKRYIDKTKEGYVKLMPEEDEDVWFLYNILAIKDLICLKISRKISQVNQTGLTKTVKKYVQATLEILKIDFTYDNSGTNLLIKTKNVKENKHIGLGQMQNVTIDLGYPITIFKQQWDKMSQGYVDESVKYAKSSEIAAILMDEGHANLYYIKNNFSIWRGKVEKSLPGKKLAGGEFFRKQLDNFYDKCFESMSTLFDIKAIKCFIIGGPGIARENFCKYMKETIAEKKDNLYLKKQLPNFQQIHTSNIHKSALNEVLIDKTVISKMSDTKAQKETQKLEEFFQVMRADPNKAVYGKLEVKLAHRLGAIKDLLITDEMFRSNDFKDRKRYIQLVNEIKYNGGTVFIFSNMHASGSKLQDLTGIAGILRYSIDIDNMTNELEELEKEEQKLEMIREAEEEEDKNSGVDNAEKELPDLESIASQG